MGCHTCKFILHLNAGVGRTGLHLVDILRMPRQRCIQIAPYAIACHKCLGRSAFFARTAIQYHRSRAAASFQKCFYTECRCKCAGSEQIVAAPVTASTRYPLFSHQTPGLLGQAGKRIVFRQDSDQRTAASIRRRKRRLNPADPLFHMKPFFFKHLTVQCCRTYFLK